MLPKLWKLAGPMVLTDLENHFYVVRFTNMDDYNRVLYGGPWMVSDRYLTVRHWTPQFDTATTGLDKIAVWSYFLTSISNAIIFVKAWKSHWKNPKS